LVFEWLLLPEVDIVSLWVQVRWAPAVPVE